MAVPTRLSGAATTVTIDGNDLHTYGMIVTRVNNPVPKARKSVVQIFGKHGDFDYTKRYGIRVITLEGYIIGDTNALVLTNEDDLKNFFRLRENGTTFQVIFSNQSTRYWECKYEGQFTVEPLSCWYYGHAKRFTLQLKCVVPYAQKTTATTANVRLNSLTYYPITYAGNVPTPLMVTLKSKMDVNVAEKAIGALNTDESLWTKSNCTGAAGDSQRLYPAASGGLKFTRTAPGAYNAYVNIFAEIDTSKYYCALVHAEDPDGDLDFAWINNGAGGSKTVSFAKLNSSSASAYDHFAFIKMSAAELNGASIAWIRLYADATFGDSFNMDGLMVYEITAAEYADDDFWPIPYNSDDTGDDKIPVKNPKLWLFGSRNIAINGHGDDITDWTSGAAVVTDPLDPSKKCIALPGGGSGTTYYGPPFFARGSTTWQLRYQIYIPYSTGNTTMGISSNFESQNQSWSNVVSTTAGTLSSWTAGDIHSGATNAEDCYLKFRCEVPANTVVYLREIQVTDYDTYEDVAYIRNDYKTAEWIGTLEEYDVLIMDFKRMIAQYIDTQAGDITNAMDNFTGDKLLLKNGVNLLRFTDARIGATDPSTESAGTADAVITYVERYL